ncbi:hypothetical protein CPC08DRAFT_707186 [Agrocybe pediades]|nr:hypothetical protein CPC08DRAFT_707186 [Agrocybe pediades]
MSKTLLTLIVASLFAASGNGSALPSGILIGRQLIPSANFVTCDFVLQPTATIDPSATNILFFEFNRDINTALSGPGIGSGTVSVSFTANFDANNTFNVQETLGAQHLTSAETTASIEGWVGTTIAGLFSNWVVNAAACVPLN